MKDFYQKKAINLNSRGIFVCDEVDRMFDMGFIEDVEFFYEKLSDDRRSLSSQPRLTQGKRIIFEYLESPVYVAVDPEKLHQRQHQQAVAMVQKISLKSCLGYLKKKTLSALLFSQILNLLLSGYTIN